MTTRAGVPQSGDGQVTVETPDVVTGQQPVATSRLRGLIARAGRDVRVDPAWREAAWLFVVSRVLLALLVTLVLRALVMTPQQRPCGGWVGVCKSLRYGLWRWDVSHYIYIAVHGYGPIHYNAAFFPLFPKVLSALGAPFGDSASSIYYIGTIVANVAMFFGYVLLYRLVRADFGESTARLATFLMAFSPLGVFFSSAYAETFFIPLTAAGLLLARRHSWLWAGVCGFLAALCRPDALALDIAYLVIACRRFGVRTLFTRERLGEKLRALSCLVLAPLAIVVYAVYLDLRIGKPLEFLTAQRTEWNRTTTWPWVSTFHTIENLLRVAGHHGNAGVNLYDLLFTVLPLILLTAAWKRIPLEYTLFGVLLALVSLVSPFRAYEPLASVPRHLAACLTYVVAYAALAKNRPRLDMILRVASVVLFVYTTVLFVGDQFVA